MLRPRGVRCHFEVELGLIMGKTVRDLREGDGDGESWLDAIQGKQSPALAALPEKKRKRKKRMKKREKVCNLRSLKNI
jgi:2-keto-4-pentenoate hydratase/2-oxohepta-3-ene-1,7-dioic acid hydratase in catechol pathway